MINKNGRFILFCLLTFLFLIPDTQASKSDSLRQVLSTTIADTTRVNVLNALSKAYCNDNPDTAVTIGASSRDLAEKIKFKPGQALALKQMGIAFYLQGKYIDAVNHWQQALEVYKSIGDKVGVANMLSNQGAVYFNQGDDAKSLQLHLQSLKMSEEVNDTLRIVTSLTNIGSIYLNKPATYKKAIDNFSRAYSLSQIINDQYLIGTSAVNLGEIYYKMNDDSTAMKYLLVARKAYDDTEDLPSALNYMGRVFIRQKEYDKALKIHEEALGIAKN
ncbi:MAG: tetratricopeptide repeat protein [Bacteroidetes bacterium]|nr:tetratricopeptide repeat protein [Bacteroidota bacterium]